MTGGFASLATAFLFAGTPANASGAQWNCEEASAAVRAVEQAWLDAYESRDLAAMDRILAPDFTITHPNARLQTKAEVLEALRNGRGDGPRFVTSASETRCRPDLVILTGWVENSGRGPQSRARYTDIYVRAAAGWQMLASHLSRRRRQFVECPRRAQRRTPTSLSRLVRDRSAGRLGRSLGLRR